MPLNNNNNLPLTNTLKLLDDSALVRVRRAQRQISCPETEQHESVIEKLRSIDSIERRALSDRSAT